MSGSRSLEEGFCQGSGPCVSPSHHQRSPSPIFPDSFTLTPHTCAPTHSHTVVAHPDGYLYSFRMSLWAGLLVVYMRTDASTKLPYLCHIPVSVLSLFSDSYICVCFRCGSTLSAFKLIKTCIWTQTPVYTVCSLNEP